MYTYVQRPVCKKKNTTTYVHTGKVSNAYSRIRTARARVHVSVYKTRGTFLYPFNCARAVGASAMATPSRAEEVSRGKTEAQDKAKQRQGPRPQRSDGRSRFPWQGSLPGRPQRPRQDPC